MRNYYNRLLNAEKLKMCYEIAPQRVQQYLQEEINYVLGKVSKNDVILDLGCGYGRIIPQLKQITESVIGVDISLANLIYGLPSISRCDILNMDAINLGFRDHMFDLVVCIQNGISAFHVNKRSLVKETIRVTKPGGKILFSTYSDKFWKYRFNWFKLQSRLGLLGEIDSQRSKDGIIICKDGFKATIMRPERFLSIIKGLNINVIISEVDESSLFYEISA